MDDRDRRLSSRLLRRLFSLSCDELSVDSSTSILFEGSGDESRKIKSSGFVLQGDPSLRVDGAMLELLNRLLRDEASADLMAER